MVSVIAVPIVHICSLIVIEERTSIKNTWWSGDELGVGILPGHLPTIKRSSSFDDAGTDVTGIDDSDHEEVDSGHSSSVPSTATSSASNTQELDPDGQEDDLGVLAFATRVPALPKAPPTGRVPLPSPPKKGSLRKPSGRSSGDGEKKSVRFSTVIEEIPGSVVTYDVISGHYYDEGDGEDDFADPWSAGPVSDKASLTPTDAKQKHQIKK